MGLKLSRARLSLTGIFAGALLGGQDPDDRSDERREGTHPQKRERESGNGGRIYSVGIIVHDCDQTPNSQECIKSLEKETLALSHSLIKQLNGQPGDKGDGKGLLREYNYPSEKIFQHKEPSLMDYILSPPVRSVFEQPLPSPSEEGLTPLWTIKYGGWPIISRCNCKTRRSLRLSEPFLRTEHPFGCAVIFMAGAIHFIPILDTIHRMCHEVLTGIIQPNPYHAAQPLSKVARRLLSTLMDLLDPAARSYPWSALRRPCRTMSGIFLALS